MRVYSSVEQPVIFFHGLCMLRPGLRKCVKSTIAVMFWSDKLMHWVSFGGSRNGPMG